MTPFLAGVLMLVSLFNHASANSPAQPSLSSATPTQSVTSTKLALPATTSTLTLTLDSAALTGFSDAIEKGISAARVGEKPVDNTARLLAGIGVLVALCGFGLGVFNTWITIKKIERDRRLSIDDDFWFRKIITPTTIEPMLKMVVELLQEMPNSISEDEKKQEFARKVTTEFLKVYASVQTLALFGEDLPSEVSGSLRKCEDTLTEYCLRISSPAVESDLVSQSLETVQTIVWKQLNETVKLIRDRQLAH